MTLAKTYRPISLIYTHSLGKWLRLYWGWGILRMSLASPTGWINQHKCNAIACIDSRVEHKKILLGSFPDTVGAFDTVFGCQKT